MYYFLCKKRIFHESLTKKKLRNINIVKFWISCISQRDHLLFLIVKYPYTFMVRLEIK